MGRVPGVLRVGLQHATTPELSPRQLALALLLERAPPPLTFCRFCDPCSAQGGRWGYSSPPPGRHGALVKKMTFLFTSGGCGAPQLLTLTHAGWVGTGVCWPVSALYLVLFRCSFG